MNISKLGYRIIIDFTNSFKAVSGEKITHSEAPKSPILGTLIFRTPRIGGRGLGRFFKRNLLIMASPQNIVEKHGA